MLEGHTILEHRNLDRPGNGQEDVNHERNFYHPR